MKTYSKEILFHVESHDVAKVKNLKASEFEASCFSEYLSNSWNCTS